MYNDIMSIEHFSKKMPVRDPRLLCLICLLIAAVAVPGYITSDGGKAVACDSTAIVSHEGTLLIVDFPVEEVPIKEWLDANDWEEQRGNAKNYVVKDRTLFMRSRDASTVIGKKYKKTPIDPRIYPSIEFRARVDEIPPGGDVTTKKKDDSAFRLFVLFDRGGRLFSPPETIGYVWNSAGGEGAIGNSGRFDQVKYIAIGSGSDRLGEWIVFKRNVLEDYRMLFGTDDVPVIKGIALKCDTNHTKSKAASAIRWIRFLPTAPE
jgi:hypothetical protein